MQNTGLTTTKAPFIEEAQSNGEIFIKQPYELYSEENQEVWNQLFKLLSPRWKKYACHKFQQGVESLRLNSDQIPNLQAINKLLEPLTGFQAKAVSGYIPSYLFFDCLKKRAFPTTITIREKKKLHYLPEPDIFHDIAGHVPMHTDRTFADVLVKFGSLAQVAANRHASIKDKEERAARTKCNIQALARFFWFTVEFGLIREKNELKVYGSGLLSSAEEIEYSIESPNVQRYPFKLEWAINQAFEIDHAQHLLFIIDSFEHLYQAVSQLETFLNEGKLDYVSPGEPSIDPEDLNAFLQKVG